MKILYLHQYFYTRNMVSNAGNRSYEFARRLVEMGHDVTMVTSYTHAKETDSGAWFETEEEGIKVHWLPNPYSNKMPFKKRIRAFLRYAVGAARRASSIKADVIFATSGPLTVALPALWASWRTDRPMVFEVRDLWPEGAIQLGVLNNPLAIAGSRFLEKTAYRRSRHIVALSPGMKEGIVARGIAPGKITMIPNAADLDLFHPEVDGSAFRRKFSLDGKFSLAYFGTMGLANGLGYVLDAAALLKQRQIDDIVFILHGDGMEREMLETKARELELTNVIFSNPFPEKEKVAELAAAVDVCMTIYNNVPVLRTCSPNKMFDAFAAGKPVLTNMPGWLGDLAEKESTGVLVDPERPEDLADKAIAMRDNPEKRQAWGENARKLAEAVFDRDKLARQLEQVLLNACDKRVPTAHDTKA
jgi:glycosyltransferase involved in cell wall biosynthesis